MPAPALSPDHVHPVATRLRALSEPARLQILTALQQGERTVGDLVRATGLKQASVSKHVHVLQACGYVARRREGMFVWVSIDDPHLYTVWEVTLRRITAAGANPPG